MDAVFSNFDDYLKAFGLTIGLFVVAGIASLVWGTILAVLRVGPISILNKAAALYVTLFRNTPLLMIFIFMAIAMPVLGYNFKFVEDVEIGGYNVSAFFFRSCIALTLYTSAFVCEALRSGINAVHLGQAEAARAVGMTFTQTLRHVVLPQAFRAVIAPLASVLIAMTKNTSVAVGVGVTEATFMMRKLTNDNATALIAIFLGFALGYMILVAIISGVANFLERKVKVA